MLARSRWHGKRFAAPDDATPLVCRAGDGSLYSDTNAGKGEAGLGNTVLADGRHFYFGLERE